MRPLISLALVLFCTACVDDGDDPDALELRGGERCVEPEDWSTLDVGPVQQISTPHDGGHYSVALEIFPNGDAWMLALDGQHDRHLVHLPAGGDPVANPLPQSHLGGVTSTRRGQRAAFAGLTNWPYTLEVVRVSPQGVDAFVEWPLDEAYVAPIDDSYRQPAIGMDAAGNVVAVTAGRQYYPGPHATIRISRVLAESGEVLGPTRLVVEDHLSPQAGISAAVANEGHFVVVYVAGSTDIHVQRFDAQAVPQGEPLIFETIGHFHRVPTPVFMPDGSLLLGHATYADGDSHVALTRILPDDTFVGPVDTGLGLSGYSWSDSLSHDIDVTPAGLIAVAGSEETDHGSPLTVRMFGPDLEPLGPPRRIAAYDDYVDTVADIAVSDCASRMLVGWTTTNVDHSMARFIELSPG